MFYEHEDEYILMNRYIGYYNDYKDNSQYDAKYGMNFMLHDNLRDKIIDIFEHIEEKLKIDNNNFTYESKGEEYLKTTVSDKTCFRIDKDNKTNIIPNEKTEHNCRVLLQVQSVYYSMKDEDIDFFLIIN